MTAHPYRPVILIDSREQAPLTFRRYEARRAALPVGDYGIMKFSDWNNPQFAVERKSLDDLAQSLGRGRRRFFREVEKLRQFRFRALVIEGTPEHVELGEYRSLIKPASVFGTLDALAVRAGLHIVWAGDSAGASVQIEGWVTQFARGIERDWRLLTTGNTIPTGED